MLEVLAQNGGLGRRRRRDPNSPGRALRRPSGHQGVAPAIPYKLYDLEPVSSASHISE